NFVTGERLKYENAPLGPNHIVAWLPYLSGNHILLHTSEAIIIAGLPNLNVERSTENRLAVLAHDKLLLSAHGRIQIHDLATHSIVETPNINRPIQHIDARFSPEFFAVTT